MAQSQKETDRKFQDLFASQRETTSQFRELFASQRETDRQLKELGKKVAPAPEVVTGKLRLLISLLMA